MEGCKRGVVSESHGRITGGEEIEPIFHYELFLKVILREKLMRCKVV